MSHAVHILPHTYHALLARYGLVGLFRPLTVYPSEMVYWAVSVTRFLPFKIQLSHHAELAHRVYFPRSVPLTNLED